MEIFKVDTFLQMNEFFAPFKMLILPGHEWSGEVCTFVCMVMKDGTVPDPATEPNTEVKMRLKTRFNTELDMKPEQVFVITSEAKIAPQNYKMN